MSFTITGPQLKMICPSLELDRATLLADSMTRICPHYGIDSNDKFHEFIANCALESGEFSRKSENMNYSAARLIEVFKKKYFKTMIEAKRFEHQPEKIANYVYGGRMGNKNEGDGFLFRGAGFMQLTGRDMLTMYANYKHSTPEAMVNLLRTSDEWAIDAACWVFTVNKKLLDEAVDDDFIATVKAINGGTNGLEDRKIYYERAKAVLVE